MAFHFFGLRPEDREQLVLEPAFLLMYYGGCLYEEIIRMPVAYKRWFIQRINAEITKTHDAGQTQSRAVHQNQPDVRELQGKLRSQSPSRLRRFT